MNYVLSIYYISYCHIDTLVESFLLLQVATFFADKDPGSGKRAVSQVLEKIQANIIWVHNYEHDVETWIETRTSSL